MLCLALSTSTDHGSVGFFKGGKLIASTQWTRNKQNSEYVTFQLQSLLKKKKLKLSSFEKVIVDYGPGSFTGSRVGVTVAKTIAHSLSLELQAVSSLDLMAADAFKKIKKPTTLLAVLDAHKSLFYCREYLGSVKAWEAHGAIAALPASEIAEKIKNGAKVVGQHAMALKPIKLPHIKNIWTLVQRKLVIKTSGLELEPLYIRNPDVLDKMSRLV